MKKEMYTNEISTSLEIRVSAVIHHLTKMQELGLLEITNKKITRKGKEHRFFKMKSNIFIIPDATREEIKEKGLLKRIFKEGLKFASIFIIAGFSFMLNPKPNPIHYPAPFGVPPSFVYPDPSVGDILFIPVFILTIGFIVERIIFGMKKRKRV